MNILECEEIRIAHSLVRVRNDVLRDQTAPDLAVGTVFLLGRNWMAFDLQVMGGILAGCTEAAEIQLPASKSTVLFSAAAVRTRTLYDG
jgi:hypothetical protein